MLDALRKGAGTWVAKLFIALLILSFGVWGVSGFLTGVGQNTVAKVGDTEVSIVDFDRTYRQDLNRLAQQFGRQLTPAEGAALGIPQQSLGQLVAEAAMDSTAKSLKLGVSDEQLAEIIQSDPAFRGANGQYDRNRLQAVLQQNGYTEDEFVVQRREVAERGQLAEGIAGSMKAPISYLEALAAYQSETRTADYLLVTPQFIGEIADPSEETLTAYFEENKADFRAPEYREINYVALTPEAVARPQDISDEFAREEYERRIDDFSQPERRRVRQLSFPTEEAADEAAAELAGGKSFEELMSARNLTSNDVALGVMTRADFLDDAIGDAVFSLDAGATSGAVDGRFSTVIVNVEEVLPESVKPFEEVRETIVTELAREQAEREILDLLDEIEDAIAGGATLSEVSERFSLKLETPAAFDASGKGEDGSDIALPEAEDLLSATFESDVGIVNDVLQLGAQGFVWFDVTKVNPARDRALDEVRADVVAAWKQEELAKRLSDAAADLLAKAESGTPFIAMAADTGLEIKIASDLRRNTPSGDFGREAVAAAFSGPVGTMAVEETADGQGRLVMKITGSNVPEFNAEAPEVATLGTQVSQQIQDTLLGQFISDQENKIGVDINNAAVARVLGLDNN